MEEPKILSKEKAILRPHVVTGNLLPALNSKI
jgi:hypothetical protein